MSEQIMRQLELRPTETTYLACQEQRHFHRRGKWCAQRSVRTLWQSGQLGSQNGCGDGDVAWEWHVIEARTRLSRGERGTTYSRRLRR